MSPIWFSTATKEQVAPLSSVVIAGGGTGGHLYPGIAVAREIQSRAPGVRISFAGTARGLESRVIPREGFELDVIRSSGLKGKSIADRLRGVAVLPLSLFDAWRLVSARRPSIVVGVGGYSAGPTVLAAALRGIPTMILEQNAMPGLTNRWLAPFVKAVALGFESAQEVFGPKAFVSGNPVRPEFVRARWTNANRVPDGVARVLVFGGSQGAHAINVAMAEAAARLAKSTVPLQLTHQTGERDLEMVRAAYQKAGMAAEVEPFFYDMGTRLSTADVIVCRAGAMTLAEVAVAGRASILIPLPTATDDHQRKNAEALASAGAAEVLLQRDLRGDVLADRLLALAADPNRRERMAQAALELARPDAARVIVDRMMALVAV